MSKITTKAILAAIGCKHLDLIKVTGSAYFYFVYDRREGAHTHWIVYRTESVMVARLTHLRLPTWVEIGKAFVANIEKEMAA